MKWLNVWTSEKVHTWSCKHTLAWLDDKTIQTIQTHMLNMIERKCGQQAWNLWLIVGRPWRHLCDSVYDSMCERDGCLHSEHNMYTQIEDLEYDQNMVTSMTVTSTCKICWWNDQARWVQRLTRADWVNQSACSHQVKLSKEALKLDEGQNFGDCYSHYNRSNIRYFMGIKLKKSTTFTPKQINKYKLSIRWLCIFCACKIPSIHIHEMKPFHMF